MDLKTRRRGSVSDQRFIAVSQHRSFILVDIEFWAAHEQELAEWCLKNFCERKGMTVEAVNDRGYMLFGLRWAG